MSFTSTLALAVQTTFAKQLQQLVFLCSKYGRVCVCEGLTVHWCVWEGMRV